MSRRCARVSIDEYRQMLGESTRHGWAFLAAYGLTWLLCAAVWRGWSARAGAYCTLFQGTVALPVALFLTAVTPGPTRPTMTGMDNVSVLLALGQVLGLPVVIYLARNKQFSLVPLAMVMLLVVHFAPYSWLYATPLYFVAGGAISVAAALAHATALRDRTTMAEREGKGEEESSAAGRVCLSTGVVMLVSAGIAWSI